MQTSLGKLKDFFALIIRHTILRLAIGKSELARLENERSTHS